MKARFLLVPSLTCALAASLCFPALAQQNSNRNRDAAARETVPTTTPVAIPPGVVVGVVDEDRLAQSYKNYSDAVDALDKRAGDLDSKIPAREFLSSAESTEFDTLITKHSTNATLSATEKTRLDALVKSGLDKRAEFMTLVGKAVRSEEEAKRMKVLQDTMAGNQTGVRTLSASLLQNIREENNTLDKKFTDNANSVIGQVAAEKKLVVVLRKGALIWWANAIDITEDVLKRLNQA